MSHSYTPLIHTFTFFYLNRFKHMQTTLPSAVSEVSPCYSLASLLTFTAGKRERMTQLWGKLFSAERERRGREVEKERRERGGGERKVCGGTSRPKRPIRCAMIGYRRAGGEREGRQRAHLQWCVLYSCCHKSHRLGEEGSQKRKGWRYRKKKKRDELLLRIQRMRDIWALHALPLIQNGEKMDLLQPVIHQWFWENPLHPKWWKFV